jgi:transcriptional regulator with XRE-family HTH domain
VKKKKPSLAETVSRNIRKARLEAGMTQKELADKAGFKVSYVARLETKPQNLSLGVLERLASSLGRSCTELVSERRSLEPSRNELSTFKQAMRLLRAFESAADID